MTHDGSLSFQGQNGKFESKMWIHACNRCALKLLILVVQLQAGCVQESRPNHSRVFAHPPAHAGSRRSRCVLPGYSGAEDRPFAPGVP